ncbi:PB1 [Musa troglodytarum]|uniref:PB1 n=2 Tax=Musa troglodytarum TaxID=320322 RepID=A0A9E7KFJ6_9LILI|nr:PB1 [Musa troglodytarum]
MEGRGIVAICQYGGEFVTNSDGSLSYSGGEAHALEVGHDMLFDDFKSELTSMFNVDVSGMSVKYFLPSNKRTLITISSDKDLQRMVDFTANALTTEVYIINKVDNRITRSTVADSGISNIGTAENARSGRRRRLNSTNRVTRARVSTVDSDTPNAITNVAGDNVYNFQEKRLFVTENDDNRMISDGFVMPITASSAAPDNARQRIITADNIDERASGSMLVDPSTPIFASLVTPDDVVPVISSPSWASIITGVGQEFDNVKDFRSQLCKYAIGRGFIYKFVKNDTTRVTVTCNEETCPWRIHASETSGKQKFVIKKMNNVHTCGGGNGKDGQRKATRQWLTSIIKEKLHVSPQCKPKELAREIYEDFGVALSYSQVWRGREVAQKELYDSMKETYSQLPWFVEKILETNPGSVALLSTSVDSKFRRFFVSFHASLHGFEHGCRPLLFLDKIPLKVTNQFKLLVAASVDGNDAIFPVAFAVVEDDNYDSWLWFLMQLKYAVTATRTITFVSNRQKGIDGAVPQAFVDSHLSYSLHHLIEDFKNELRKGPWSSQVKDAMISDFTRAAQACTMEEFNASVESIRNFSAEAAEWVMASKPENWSDAIFKGSRYDHFSTNIVDSLSNWIPARKEPSVVQMIDAIRDKLAEVMEERRGSCNAWVGTLTPAMEQKLQTEMSKARKLNVLCSSDTVFEVRGNTISVVNIGSWECTCRRWQISGLPCVHAIAVFNRINRSADDYCSRYFRIEFYQSAYSALVHPIPDVGSIDFYSGVSSYPPPARRPPGRPRRKRFNHKTSTVVRLCSRCKAAGHNKATCEAFL